MVAVTEMECCSVVLVRIGEAIGAELDTKVS